MPDWAYTMSAEFWNDLALLPSDVLPRAHRTLSRLMQDPWAPELHPERVQSAERGVHSARVDEKYRIIWKHIKPNDILFCLVDNHDEAYRRAARKSFVLQDGMVKIAEITEVGATRIEAAGGLFGWLRPKEEKVGALFVGYRDAELLGFGVPAELLPNLRALDDMNQLPSVERLLPEEVYLKLLEIALGEVQRPVVPDENLRQSLERHQGGDELYRFVNSEEFQRALTGELKDWMLFLAAPQRYLVHRQYNGPARIRGVAGSGKTVIAIHRTRLLARQALQNGRLVLVVTYGNRLPGTIAYLLNQLCGDSAPELGAIECRSVHQWCSQFLAQRGLYLQVNTDVQRKALEEAIAQIRSLYPSLRLMGRAQSFFEAEIRYVIKGKDIQTLQDYLSLDRSGRGTALQINERRAMFAVYQAYQANLNAQNHHDFDDFILAALRQIETNGYTSPYHAAVVDELQDLTEATLRLIRRLVPPGPNDLFLVGDGLQRIYPGGVSLARNGIDVSGRGSVLRRNYRNTQEILRAAHAMMSAVKFDDIDEEAAEAQEPEYSLRHGEIPHLLRFAFPEHEIDWVGSEIAHLQKEKGYQPDEMAVLFRARYPYQEMVAQRLKTYQPVELERDPMTYFGPGLKYTTFHSAKGLEFKIVFVVGVTDGSMVPKDDWSLQGEELDEYLAREQRLLYVAMTRARDRLYLSYARGKASRFLDNVPEAYLPRG